MPDAELEQPPAKVKRRRISEKDFSRLSEFVFSELDRRKGSKFRKTHENVWREVDRQIAMEPPATLNRSGRVDEDWHNAVQLGLLADASEILTDNILRLAMPSDRTWFQPHIELEWPIGADGQPDFDPRRQRSADKSLQSFLVQQHKDFGLRDRVKLSVKEAYHHGSSVVEIRMQRIARYHDGTRVETLAAPTWVPHSMWNCYPDPSPSVVGTDLFYTGSMIIESFMKREDMLRQPNWKHTDKVPKSSPMAKTRDVGNEDVHIVKYFGNASLERRDGDLFLPNRLLIFANEQLVFTEVNATPYSPILYFGHERDDVRDPYYTSPVVKRSPMAKLATRLANKFMDAVDLRTEPPLVYDKHDTHMAAGGGPIIAPGAQNQSSGTAEVKPIVTADPSWAQQGLLMMIAEVEKGTSVDAARAGVSSAIERTATEVIKTDARAETRDVDFVGTLERQALKPFLYMQHDLNRAKLETYPFFNADLHSPDFMRAQRRNLPEAVHFEIVGSRSLLGEEQRILRLREAAAFHASNEFLAQLTDWQEVSRELWESSGAKDPERFMVIAEGDEDQTQAAVEQAVAEVTQQAQQALGQLQQQNQKLQADNQKLVAEGQVKDIQQQQLKLDLRSKDIDINALQEAQRILTAKEQAEDELERLEQRIRGAAEQVQRDRAGEGEQTRSAVTQTQGAVREVTTEIRRIESERAAKDAEREAFVQQVLAEIEKRDADMAGRLRAAREGTASASEV